MENNHNTYFIVLVPKLSHLIFQRKAWWFLIKEVGRVPTALIWSVIGFSSEPKQVSGSSGILKSRMNSWEVSHSM